MPELPDVEAVRRYLSARGLEGLAFTGATILWPKAIKTPSLEEFVLGITGRRIGPIGRRAKYLLFPLDDGQTLIAHLRMTGSLLVEPATQDRHPMTRNIFSLDDGRELRLVDPRKLGMVWLVQDTAQVLKGLGPEPLEPDFTPQALGAQLRGRKVPIKALLCDQAVVAGIGNIYADEVLFVSGVHPLTQGSEVTGDQVKKMHGVIIEILSWAIERMAPLVSRGGPPTESAEGLLALEVPRKRGGSCSWCDDPIVRVAVRGRSTYFCPRCQPQ
jgi:formamidopyrimidine-DNA glycosylase